MTGRDWWIGPAERQHAADLARFQDMADDGLPRIFWEKDRQPGETVMDAGRRKYLPDAARTDIRVARDSGGILGAALSYEMTPPGPPAHSDLAPLVALKSLAVGDWYLDGLAVAPAARRRGVAAGLLADVVARAARTGATRLSLLVLEGNTGARRLYDRDGWMERGRQPLAPTLWQIPAQDMILLSRPVATRD